MIGECPNPRISCPFAPRCASNTHHLYFPANSYQTPLERLFRELPENKEQMCMYEHQLLHELTEAPKKPSLEEMLRALGRVSL